MARIDLKSFKRERPDAGGTVKTHEKQESRSPEWVSFERDVRAALASLRDAALASTGAADAKPAKVTVSAVMKAAGRSRASLYAEHPELLKEIDETSSTVAETMRASSETKPKTKEQLRADAEIIEAGLRGEIADLASQQVTDLIDRMGPAARDRARLMQENLALKERVRELETVNANQANMLSRLMEKVNR